MWKPKSAVQVTRAMLPTNEPCLEEVDAMSHRQRARAFEITGLTENHKTLPFFAFEESAKMQLG
eukprot:CCRYP_008404-RA/>CCRYP_008404-RA protein AED:0.27 eAED:0.27 QI:138/0.5/0.66/1/0/0/3/511/63